MSRLAGFLGRVQFVRSGWSGPLEIAKGFGALNRFMRARRGGDYRPYLELANW